MSEIYATTSLMRLAVEVGVALEPGRGTDFGDLPVGHAGKAGEHIAQVNVGIHAATATVLDVFTGCMCSLQYLSTARRELGNTPS